MRADHLIDPYPVCRKRLVTRFQHPLPSQCALLRMLEPKGPPANIRLWRSLGFDIRFHELASRLVANVKSTPLASSEMKSEMYRPQKFVGGILFRLRPYSKSIVQPVDCATDG